jgi:hypothetical protein
MLKSASVRETRPLTWPKGSERRNRRGILVEPGSGRRCSASILITDNRENSSKEKCARWDEPNQLCRGIPWVGFGYLCSNRFRLTSQEISNSDRFLVFCNSYKGAFALHSCQVSVWAEPTTSMIRIGTHSVQSWTDSREILIRKE